MTAQFLRTALQTLYITAAMGLFGSIAYAGKPVEQQQPASTGTPKNAATLVGMESAWIRPTAPGQTVSGAFMKLTNPSGVDYALTSVEYADADVVEIHETSMANGMMKMRQVEQVEIPANGTAELKPGSYHIMLIGLKKNLEAGSTETLVLVYSDGSRKFVEVPVAMAN